MNKKVRNLRKTLRVSRNASKNIAASLNLQIVSLKKQVEVLSSQLSTAKFDLKRSERDSASAISGYKELECFRVAVNNSHPFGYYGPCDILNLQMQIDVRSFEFGMFRAASREMMPLCKILNYVEHDLSRQITRKLEQHIREKGINV